MAAVSLFAGADQTCRADDVKPGERIRFANGPDAVEIIVERVRPTIGRCVCLDGPWELIGPSSIAGFSVAAVGPNGMILPAERTVFVMPAAGR